MGGAAAVAAVALALAAAAAAPAAAFYLPGIAPNDYDEGAPLEVLANKLTSTKNHVPFDYFSLPFCRDGARRPRSHRLSLGQVMMGERAEPTQYALAMKVPETCRVACESRVDAKGLAAIRARVKDDYLVRLNLDNLPVIMRGENELGDQVFQLGFPVGYPAADKKRMCVYNHVSFTVLFHKPSFPTRAFYSAEPENVFRVVGFEAVPMSVDHKYAAGSTSNLTTCPVTAESRPLCFGKGQNSASITYSYDVKFVESPIQWATRWDSLLNANPELKEIQWFSIINSLMISLFLSAMVAMILLRTVYLDFARYNNIDDDEEIQDESGWKLIHGDVFRPPQYSGLLAVLVGSGAQLLSMTAVTLVFAVAGFLSPANRGGLLTALLTLWVFASSICGYWAARIYSGMGGTNKKSVTLGSAFLFSGTYFVVFFAINFLLWVSGSSGAIPFLTLLLLLVMWFGISVPLNVVGAFIGYKQKPYEYPCRTNQIPREIPKTSTIPPLLFSVFAGILPFGVVFMELVFTLNSIWQNEIFYFFGFMVAVFLILAITCAEVSVVMTYLTLCKEDFHHWWRSFVTAGSSGLYVFGYSMVFLFTQPGLEGLHIVSTLVYTGYMFLAAFGFSLMTGCIGYAASTLFVRKLYQSVHIA